MSMYICIYQIAVMFVCLMNSTYVLQTSVHVEQTIYKYLTHIQIRHFCLTHN